jgi:multidrug resistance efflux pump
MMRGMGQKESSSEPSSTAGTEKPAREKRNIGRVLRSPVVLGVILILIAAGAFFGVRYVQDSASKIYIETSEISAPLVSLGPDTPGTLKLLYVKEGDKVAVGQQLFSVGNSVVSAKTAGVITTVQNTPGQFAGQQSVIVQMYDPAGLRVVGHIQEDQGLSDIKVGQKAMFTVDAYGSREYEGTVESIARTADQASLAFSISDKRQEKQFAVKVAFDANAYPEVRNGMSARLWILK